MAYDPNDFQDQAAVLAALQRQRQLELSSRKKIIPENRACPWCGGELPGVVKKCMHCASDVSWFGGQPCNPEDLDELKEESQRREQQRAKESQQREKYLNEETKCLGCNSESIRRNLTDGRCRKCKRKDLNYGCLFLFSLLVIPLLYFWWSNIADGFPKILELGVGYGVFFSICFALFSFITGGSCDSVLCGVLSLILLLLVLSLLLGMSI